MAGPTAEEQLYIELINETRLNPVAAAARYINSYAPLASSDPGVQSALTYFGVDGAALQAAFAALTPVGPLAWNDTLGATAEAHSAAMIAADDQQHQLPGEEDLGTRITKAGYTGWTNLGENIYAYSESAIYGHAGFMIDWGNGPGGMQSPAGHRNNLMNAAYREIGVDVTLETNAATKVGPEVTTEDLGARSGKYFVVGVAYTDSDKNAFYSVGEGRGDLTVKVAAASITSFATGGYALGVGTGPITVTLAGGGLASAVTLNTTISTDNIKLDVVDGNTLLSSGSIAITSGSLAVVRGLGARGLSLSAGAGDQTLEGTSGNDTLIGGAGNDTIIGNGGTDTAVYTGNRADYLITQVDLSYRLVDQRVGTHDGNDLTTGVAKYQFADGLVLAANLLSGSTNTTPVANPDNVATSEDVAVRIAVLANDTDANGDTLSVSGVGNPAHGTVLVNPDNTITYTPNANFNGGDSFTYSISDGKGGAASSTVTVAVAPVNDAPTVASSTEALATAEDTPLSGGVMAADVDGDTLNYSITIAPAHGTAAIDASTGRFTYSPNKDYNGTDTFVAAAADPSGATVTQTVNLTVTPVNDPPRAADDNTSSLTVAENTSGVLVIDFNDIEGNTPLTLAVIQGPAHGTFASVSGVNTYSPAPNYSGSDSLSYTVTDNLGASTSQTVAISVTAAAPPANVDWRLFAGDGFKGEVGGSGSVFGTAGFQDVSVLDQAGLAVFDPSFNRGADVIRLSGSAAGWEIARDGSSALLSDGDTFVEIPLGSAGTAIAFDDGARELKVDGGTPMLGNQSFGLTFAAVTAGPDGTLTSAGALADASGRLFLASGGAASAGGSVSIFGTPANETVTLLAGNITLDPSFNRGGDSVLLDHPATDFTASQVGSSVFLDSPDTDVHIPVGTAGMMLTFTGGDTRELVYDTALASVRIGEELIGSTPVVLSHFA